jgi:hypothetical protein
LPLFIFTKPSREWNELPQTHINPSTALSAHNEKLSNNPITFYANWGHATALTGHQKPQLCPVHFFSWRAPLIAGLKER